MEVRLYVELKKVKREFGSYPLCINISYNVEKNDDIMNFNRSDDSVSVLSLEAVVQSNSMDTLAITSNELDDSNLIDNNQCDFVISDRKQKHVREAQTYKDKSIVVVVMRRYAIDQRFQYKVHRTNSKREFHNGHTYQLKDRVFYQRQASSAFVGGIIAPKYENHKRKYKPRDIIDDMKLDLGVDISDMKA
ncbi:hypothetical protein HAX54_017290 [Datura stramonium]|uniref:Uncharacterized protein n=1 Tax=Datura stramonium TaxID=4076 RepID=A0ABS8UM32_DATST|nr:hypothetical protein [Datura stramonium]